MIEIILKDADGNVVERQTLAPEQAARKAAEFVRLHGGTDAGDGDSGPYAGQPGSIEFRPI